MMKRKILWVLLPCILLALLSTSVQAFAVLAEPTDGTTASAEESTSTTPDVPPATAPETNPSTEDTDPMPNDSVALEAPEGLRAGELVTFTFLCKGDNVRGLQGSLSYDPALLTYEMNMSTSLADSWRFTFSDEEGTLKYLGYCTEGEGTDGKQKLFSVTFRITEGTETGTPLSFTVADAIAYNGTEVTFTGSKLNTAVTRPLSNECTLTALSVEGGALNPAFSPAVTQYTVNLPYSAEQANISATACENAGLEMGNSALMVGENTVTITVIAESGIQQVYTLTVIRAADPNYIPSSDNRILSVTLSEGLLFPAFSPDILDYSLYLVKGQTVTLTPTAATKAVAETVTIPGDKDDTLYTLVCTAESGITRTYNIRTILLETPQELHEIQKQNEQAPKRDLITTGLLAFAAITVFFLGFVVSYLIFGRRKKSAPSPTPAPEDASSTEAIEEAQEGESAPTPELVHPAVEAVKAAEEAPVPAEQAPADETPAPSDETPSEQEAPAEQEASVKAEQPKNTSQKSNQKNQPQSGSHKNKKRKHKH